MREIARSLVPRSRAEQKRVEMEEQTVDDGSRYSRLSIAIISLDVEQLFARNCLGAPSLVAGIASDGSQHGSELFARNLL